MLAGAASRPGLRTQSNGVYGSSAFTRDTAALGAGVDVSTTSGLCCSDSWSGDGKVDGVALDAVVVEGGVAEASYVEGVEVGTDMGAVDEDEGELAWVRVRVRVWISVRVRVRVKVRVRLRVRETKVSSPSVETRGRKGCTSMS